MKKKERSRKNRIPKKKEKWGLAKKRKWNKSNEKNKRKNSMNSPMKNESGISKEMKKNKRKNVMKLTYEEARTKPQEPNT